MNSEENVNQMEKDAEASAPHNQANNNNRTLSSDDDEDEDVVFKETAFSSRVKGVEDRIHGFLDTYSGRIRLGIYNTLLGLYLLYYGYCMHHKFGDERSIILTVITVCLLWKVLFVILESRGVTIRLPQSFHSSLKSKQGRRFRNIARYAAYVAAGVAIVTYLAVDVFPENTTNLQSFIGLLVMIGLCFIFSIKPSRVNWHTVYWAFVIQISLAYFTLRTKAGREIFDWLGEFAANTLSYSDAGSAFVIGREFRSWGLAMWASGIIIFTNAVLCLFIYWGAIEFVVLKVGGFLGFCLETGPVESVVAAANIFIGLTEAPLMIRPYLPTVTKSEIHTVITCGFASISGAGLGIFMNLGSDDQRCPTTHHL